MTSTGGAAPQPRTGEALDGGAVRRPRPGRPLHLWRDLRERPERLQFGGDEFRRVDDLVHAVQAEGSRWRKVRVGVTRPGDALAAVRLLALLPRERVRFSDSGNGRRAVAVHGRSLLGVDLPQLALSVLDVPRDVDASLSGRPRRALRTGLNQARRLGLECVEVDDLEQRRTAADEVAAGRRGAMHRSPPARTDDPGHRWFVARSTGGTAVACIVVLVDGGTAVMRYSVAVADPAVSSAARYALHTHVLRALSAAGVRTLVLNTPFGWAAGQHEFQRIVGYRVAHVVPGGPAQHRG